MTRAQELLQLKEEYNKQGRLCYKNAAECEDELFKIQNSCVHKFGEHYSEMFELLRNCINCETKHFCDNRTCSCTWTTEIRSGN